MSHHAPTSRGWLIRTGHGWKVWLAGRANLVPILILVVWVAADRSFSNPPPWIQVLPAVTLALGLPSSLAVVVLRSLVRCPVCGLRLASCSQARSLGSRKWLWIASLEECPSCGDDGSATEQSRSRWQRSGQSVESPYWSERRIMIGLVLVILLVGGGVWWGGSYRPNPATWAHDFVPGVTVK